MKTFPPPTLIHETPSEKHMRYIDSYRWLKNRPWIEYIRDRVWETVNRVISMTSKEEIKGVINRYLHLWQYSLLKKYFLNNNQSFLDLIRKCNKYRINNHEMGWFLPEEWKHECLKILLTRWALKLSDKAKFKNQLILLLCDRDFIEFTSTQPSILDSSWYSFSLLPTNKSKNEVWSKEQNVRKKKIEQLIRGWLVRNNPKMDEEKIEKIFSESHHLIIEYFYKIFWKDFPSEVKNARSILWLTASLEEMFKSWNVENAWRIVQSYEAWWNIIEMKENFHKTEKVTQDIPWLLNAYGIKIDNKKISTHTWPNWNISYSSSASIWEKEYTIKWRAKTLMSELQKKWCKLEYTNTDSTRDSLWIAIIHKDDASLEEKRSIAQTLSQIMVDNAFMFDNKWTFPNHNYDLSLNKKPLIIDQWLSSNSSGNFESFSMSGFVKLGRHSPVWLEIQCYSESTAKWKDEEDPYYKIRSATDALIRWPKYAHINELYNLFRTRIAIDELKPLGITSIEDFFIKIISDKYLLPYITVDWRHLIFSYKWKDTFLEKAFTSQSWYTNIRKINPDEKSPPKSNTIKDYINAYCESRASQ